MSIFLLLLRYHVMTYDLSFDTCPLQASDTMVDDFAVTDSVTAVEETVADSAVAQQVRPALAEFQCKVSNNQISQCSTSKDPKGSQKNSISV